MFGVPYCCYCICPTNDVFIQLQCLFQLVSWCTKIVVHLQPVTKGLNSCCTKLSEDNSHSLALFAQLEHKNVMHSIFSIQYITQWPYTPFLYKNSKTSVYVDYIILDCFEHAQLSTLIDLFLSAMFFFSVLLLFLYVPLFNSILSAHSLHIGHIVSLP